MAYVRTKRLLYGRQDRVRRLPGVREGDTRTMTTIAKPDVSYDAKADVLYVKMPGAKIVDSGPLDDDDFVIVNRDSVGRMVGLRILCASEITAWRWERHFAHDVQTVLFEAVATWLANRKAS